MFGFFSSTSFVVQLISGIFNGSSELLSQIFVEYAYARIQIVHISLFLSHKYEIKFEWFENERGKNTQQTREERKKLI